MEVSSGEATICEKCLTNQMSLMLAHPTMHGIMHPGIKILIRRKESSVNFFFGPRSYRSNANLSNSRPGTRESISQEEKV